MLSGIAKKVIKYNRAKSVFLSCEDVVEKISKITEECSRLRDPKDPIIHYYKKFLEYIINNLGDPFSTSRLFINTKELEMEVIKHFGSLYLLEENNLGGYVEWDFRRSELFIMNIILNRFDDKAILIIPKEVSQRVISIARVFNVSSEQIKCVKPDPVSKKGMNLVHLAQIIAGLNEETPIAVWLSLGDNNGNVDNLNEIKRVLEGRKRVHIHYSCSNLGVMLPYVENDLGINFQNGLDSIALPLSGFLGVPITGGVAITRLSFTHKSVLEYTVTREKDSTVAGSRNGHLPLLLWIAIRARGTQGIKEEVARVHKNTTYLKKMLEINGKNVVTDKFKSAIFFETYSMKLIDDWNLCRIIGAKNTFKFEVQPHFTKSKLDSFIVELLNVSPKNKVDSKDDIPDEVQKLYPLSETDQLRLHNIKQNFNLIRDRYLGFPMNMEFGDLYVKEILKIFEYNITHKSVEGLNNEIFEFLSSLLRIPREEMYGVITSGGSFSNLLGCLIPRNYFENPVGYVSEDAHYSVVKCTHVIRMDCSVIKSQKMGELDYEELEKQIIANQPRPVIISLNIGSTMQGAIDNIVKVKNIFKKLNITLYHIHCDAALDGGYLQFINDAPHHGFDIGIDSLAVSMHKYLGSPIPCSIFLTRKNLVTSESKEIIDNIFSVKDSIITAIIWYMINHHRSLPKGSEAKLQLEKTNYLYQKLKELSINTWKNEFSNIVCFDKPSDELIYKWYLATVGDASHVVLMQHVSYDMLNAFIEDFRKEIQSK